MANNLPPGVLKINCFPFAHLSFLIIQKPLIASQCNLRFLAVDFSPHQSLFCGEWIALVQTACVVLLYFRVLPFASFSLKVGDLALPVFRLIAETPLRWLAVIGNLETKKSSQHVVKRAMELEYSTRCNPVQKSDQHVV